MGLVHSLKFTQPRQGVWHVFRSFELIIHRSLVKNLIKEKDLALK